ncbi:hypothetical protein AWB68_07873 [Caballeronia choica]|uniref:Lipoprotein n=1 Tax=Caballeronia choica TaxID=326476 RepID=A0A158KXW5_9BURK|nr:hypothetical protein [Caballeronia choica]SAL85996.1 hypothetical protein AWB68_07873 [Caballeronia choica]
MITPRFALFFLFLCAGLGLSGCATNMTSVATFGDATAAVAQQTTEVLPKMPQNCRELQTLFSEQRAIVSSALTQKDTKNQPVARKAALSAANDVNDERGQLDVYVESLASASGTVQGNCKLMDSYAPQLQALSSTLASYASAVKALAQDQYVTYRPEYGALSKSVGSIPVGGTKSLLDPKQVDAINGVEALIYKLATQSYRQSKLKEVLDNSKPVENVIQQLQIVAGLYLVEIQGLAVAQLNAAGAAKVLQQKQLLFEPIAVQEYVKGLQAQQSVTKSRASALQEYIQVLSKVGPTLTKARDSINRVPLQDTVREIEEFAHAAYSAQQSLRDAF